MSPRDISNFRQEYGIKSLSKATMASQPLHQFKIWFDEALKADVPEPNAMTLATVDAEGNPTVRIVLLKEANSKGLVFFSNYQSRKGRELAEHPQAALNFFWQSLERQVRVEGRVKKLSEKLSDEYFKTRPRGSQLGAWVSPQSQEIPTRAFLEAQLEAYQERFQGKDIPRPQHWGGYILIPQVFEFWQGRENRLHDRMMYEQSAEGWTLKRLAP